MSIRKLPDDLVNRIAAGEVVERPASVIKELVENAIDAGADRIAVTTSAGGKSLIRVADNGEGMGAADLRLSVERHATSKLDQADLSDIRSLGFRGEALASIGSVSSLRISSRHADEDSGNMLKVHHGKAGEVTPTAMNIGTTISVEDLFAHVPARLKFLKTDRAETAAITDSVKRLAMVNPHVHFSLEGSDRSTLNWPAQNGDGAIRARLAQILGAEFIENAVDVGDSRHNVVVRGLAGLPTYTRANSLQQFVFVNGRTVRDKVLIGAIRAAYSDLIFRDRFPVVALYVSVAPDEIDVNVHPQKAEVRFRDAGGVRSAVINAVGRALEGAGYRASRHVATAAKDAFTVGGHSSSAADGAAHLSAGAHHHPFAGVNVEHGQNGPLAREAEQTFDRRFDEPSADYFPASAPSGDNQTNNLSHPLGAARAQLFENYIVAQSDDGLVLVDQHAAHERLVYEKFKQQLGEGPVASQAHLIPVVVELPEEDCDRLIAASDSLIALGLHYDRFGPRAIAVRETPALLGQPDVRKLINDLADGLAEWDNIDVVTKRLEAIIARMACHGSVRSGRVLRPDEMNALLRQMETSPHSGQCIHGRPTYIELKKTDLDKLFGRE